MNEYIEDIHEIHDDFRDIVTLLIFLSNLEKLLAVSHYLIWIGLFFTKQRVRNCNETSQGGRLYDLI